MDASGRRKGETASPSLYASCQPRRNHSVLVWSTSEYSWLLLANDELAIESAQ
jgi:hypothetical protein